MAQLVLRFIAGPQQGKEFALEPGCEIVIGRDADADLIVRDETVSRKHAVITCRDDEVVLQDHSRNGTYINGRRVSRVAIHLNDQIQIGPSILKLMTFGHTPFPNQWVASDHDRGISATSFSPSQGFASFGQHSAHDTVVAIAPAPVTAPRLSRLANVPAAGPKPMPAGSSTAEHFRGSITDIALPDLLQLLCRTHKTGILVITSGTRVGKIFLNKGQICHAQMGDRQPKDPHKIFYRIMRWEEGIFELEIPDNPNFPATIDEPTEFLLLEAMHQLDEIANLGIELLPYRTEVCLAQPLPASLRDLSPGDLDFIQLALRHKTVGEILDHYNGSDFEGYTYLMGLIGRKFLVASLPA